MTEIIPLWIMVLFMAVFGGYYTHMAWRKPQEFAKTVLGWGHMNPLLPDSWGLSATYRILTQIFVIFTFIFGSIVFLVLSFAILARVFDTWI